MKAPRGFSIAIAVNALLFAASTFDAAAGVIRSPASAVIDVGGPGFGSIDNTLNQSGLISGFTSGVTDFDAYLATNPQHATPFPGAEWFSELGSSAATVTYDFGAIFNIARLALWNEESAGIGLLNLSTSTNNVIFTALASGLTPTDNPGGISYGADVFAFGTTSARYVRFGMSNCPQPITNDVFIACGIGEVAFDTVADQQFVPEPGTCALIGGGLLGLAMHRRRGRADAARSIRRPWHRRTSS